jgi:hypothetical protein
VNDWPAVTIMIIAQIAAAAFLVRRAARRWWEYLVIAALTVALVRPAEHYITGDVSRYLPDAIWSGADDKEQIICVSAASTILLPLIVSAFAFYVFKQVRQW